MKRVIPIMILLAISFMNYFFQIDTSKIITHQFACTNYTQEKIFIISKSSKVDPGVHDHREDLAEIRRCRFIPCFKTVEYN